ncbi:O-methyltransferase [Mycena crocata]|nr:O-methyltransferase [Mycena crocata]
MQSISILRLLSDLISESVSSIENAYAAAGLALPSLDKPFSPKDPAEQLKQDPIVSEAVTNIIAAAGQLTATVRDPVASALASAHAFQLSSCLRAASEFNVAEILRDSGDEGVAAKEIGSVAKTNPDLLARILRLLATHHIFREVSPGVFANNRISSTLDKGKPASVLFDKPEDRLTGSSGTAAYVELLGDQCLKSAAFMPDTLLEPLKGDLPFNRAFGTPGSMFAWFERPDNKYRLARFTLAMHGGIAANDFSGFSWDSLPQGSVVVDVGAGIGSTVLAIAQKNPSLSIVIQDRAATVEHAKKHWAEHFPSHVENQLVHFQAHDFFESQPVKNASVFFMRHCIHNYSDDKVIPILRHLREAALPTTKLVIMDRVIAVASGVESEDPKVQGIPGATRPSAKSPLLSNWGEASAGVYHFDMTMHNLLGATERTLEGFYNVMRKTGWNLVQVYHSPGSQSSHIVAEPT